MICYYKCANIKDENCGLFPFSHNVATAVLGFHQMGIECYKYYDLREIESKFTKEDVLIDGIAQVNHILSLFDIIPEEYDYPEILTPFLGRKIYKSTINTVNSNPSMWGNFVKPIKDKMFTGRVINSPADLVGCGNWNEDYEVLVSEPVKFIYEARGFIYYDKMIDLRPYGSDWHNINKLDPNIIDSALRAFCKWEGRPNVCSLDWGATDDGRTLLVEMNSFSATGCYGLDDIAYAKMISAYFAQVFNVKDICKF